MTIEHKVSVIITTYNSEKFIIAAIKSALQQIDVVIEVIIVDDCSDDFNLLQDKVALFKDQVAITVKQPKQKGNANVSRNMGIDQAQYPYIAFLDADDTWNAKHLTSCIKAIESNDLDGCFSKVILIANNVHEKSTPCYQDKSDICAFIFNQNGISVTSSLVMKKSTLLDIHFDNDLFKHQDWDFLIRYTKKYNLGQSPYYGLNYTLSTGTNMSSTYNFSASINFMNYTLPTFWHAIFLSSQLNKILLRKQHEELLKLSIQIKGHYKFPLSTLGYKNYCIIQSAQNKMTFSTLTNFFKIISKVKYTLRSCLK
ncbi:MAG: glycosyltransferase family 2 protein [Colwellia sp.]|nr:glycosyltransferase family 2 protein [Colwellia sp.]